MTHINGLQRTLTGSFGIISPETNRVQTFEGEISGEYLSPNEPPLSYPSSEEPEEYPNNPTASLDPHHGDSSITDATQTSPVISTEPLPTSAHPRLPKLARSVSMPVEAHLGHLKPPISLTQDPSSPSSYDEVSKELAESVQAIVQTLLHLSPPHILDPVKELFSACTVQLPTPSVSALLTTMKNLNYLSANIRTLAPETPTDEGSEPDSDSTVSDNFDIGEVVQSVGDVLSGVAAQAAVDLAIFHGDVGMRHINVMGDEQSILFILTHVRQN